MQSSRVELDEKLNEISKALTDAEARLNTKTQEMEKNLSDALADVQQRALSAQFETQFQVAERFAGEGDWGMAYLYFIDALEAATEIGYAFWAEPSLDGCIEMLKNGAALSEYENSLGKQAVAWVLEKFSSKEDPAAVKVTAKAEIFR